MPPRTPSLYQQSAAIPYRRTAAGLQVLMVTSRGGGRWLFPKGGIGKGLSPADSALREAYEEAGVLGDLHATPVGRYRFRKRDMPRGAEACDVEVFLLHVRRQLETWPEKGQRRLRWVDIGEAALMAQESGLVEILLRLAQEDLEPG